MFPKEHGAYGQLIFPLVTALAVGGASVTALLIGLAAAAAFMSHEPLLVLLGRRGPRAARETGGQARLWWALSTGVAVIAGASAVAMAPADTRWSFVWPLVPAAGVALAIARHREKSAPGELCVAAAFSAVAIPVCRVAGASAPAALAVALAFLGVFLVSTLAVRVVILKVRGGGSTAGVLSTRRVLFVVLGLMIAGLATAAWRGALPWAPLIATAPSWLVSVSIALKPPPPARLRRVGWTLMSASAAATLILIASLWTGRT